MKATHPLIKPAALYHCDEVRTVHLELTHRCNAACPMCARNIYGGAINPDMPMSELTLANIKKILVPEFVAHLKRIYACGNYGDPIVARDCLEIFRYLRQAGPQMNLCMHTNGSARRPDWWSELANIMKQGLHYVRFGIDGLEDTNHLYRRGTDWKTIIDGPLFQSEIPASWNLESVAAGKLAICARTCGVEYDSLCHQRD